MDHDQPGFRSGFVSVIGRPNVGKSTLLNRLMGEKLLIVSDKPQTTRNRIRCILTDRDFQIVFMDTPGIHKPRHRLGQYMVKTALRTLEEVDVIVLVADAEKPFGSGDEFVLKELSHVKTPVVLVLNKIDLVDSKTVQELEDLYRRKFSFTSVLAVSALKGEHVLSLTKKLIPLLPEGPQYYPDDMIIDHPERFVTAELIREKVIQLTKEEVPHAVAVEIEEMKEREENIVYIRALIHVERESQKGIVVGAGGKRLKEIGTLARQDIENLLGSKVYLDLWVHVQKDWRKKDRKLKQFGYE